MPTNTVVVVYTCCGCCSWSLKHTFSDVKSISSNEQFTDCASCCCCCWCAILICYFLLFCCCCCGGGCDCCCCCYFTHTHTLLCRLCTHQRTTHIYMYAHTEALDVVNSGWLYFFLLVTCVVYNLTQFNYIRIAVRYVYFGQNEERERETI